MGTYLSVPVTEKGIEESEDLNDTIPLAWGVVDMQGWRKTMEDAHIAQTDTPPPPSANVSADAKVFAVFDGHGGAEVARFCQLYLLDVLTNQEGWKGDNVNVGAALVSAFHALDDLIDDPDRREEINGLKTEKPDSRERRTLERSMTTPAGNNSEDQIMAENVKVISSSEKSDDDSDGVSGEIGDDRLDSNETAESEGNAESAAGLFKKLLSINQGAAATVPQSQENIVAGEETVITPTRIINGRQICNLPDHPIHAGCTAVCAVIVGTTLTVANAGDSRVVLCRNDQSTEAMSFDHKPSHQIERNRITEAGGFVNQFGRVNGNLNLSRSIGDLKYKQVPNIAPPDQMITAEPDIKSVTLNPDDEFVILACDGIWDCLTNEEAVKYVLDRIDTKTPSEIGTEMLDQIISVDPRVTQGIGGDNMTVMIVDLQPHKRSYHNSND